MLNLFGGGSQPLYTGFSEKKVVVSRNWMQVKRWGVFSLHALICIVSSSPYKNDGLNMQVFKFCYWIHNKNSSGACPSLCTYHWLSRGLTPGTPMGNPREHAGNGTFLTIFWARGVGTLFCFGNERFRPQGCTPGIWSALVSGTWFSKSRMNSLPPFVFHFLDLLHVCSSSCRCTKPGMLRRKRKSVIADSFDEFVVKGELNSISSDFVVSEHTFLIF